MKVSFILTRYSATFPRDTFAFTPITSRPVIPRRVLAARFSPVLIASSTLFFEEAVISQLLPVVAVEHEDRIFPQPRSLKTLDDATNFAIYMRDERVVVLCHNSIIRFGEGLPREPSSPFVL